MKKSLILVLGVLIFICSCKSNIAPEPPVIPTDDLLKLTIDTKSGNHLDATETNGKYSIKTTGEDPFLYLNGLKRKLKPEELVLTFEYTSTAEIGMQLFFTPPTTEGRSISSIVLPASSSMKTFSIDIGAKSQELKWGNSGDKLRLDFGNKSGVTIELKGLSVRERNEEEKKIAKEKEDFKLNDQALNEKFLAYLGRTFSSKITQVKVDLSTINLTGSIPNFAEGYSLVEILPGGQPFDETSYGNPIPITTATFSIQADRFQEKEGLRYDRGLSRWAIVRSNADKLELQSHARYADEIQAKYQLTASKLKSKKGLGGYDFNRGFQSDLDDLQISSVTVNVSISSFLNLSDRGNSYAHNYNGKMYYMSKSYIDNLDKTFKAAFARDIVVSAIILVQSAAQSVDPSAGNLLQHPNFAPGANVFFTMPRMDNLSSIHAYAAALDFLASRYCQPGSPNGRIHSFIMHNEVDQGIVWTNMGPDRPLNVFLDNYYQSMRLAYAILRNYDSNAEVLGSFTHSWNESATGGDYFAGYYTAKEMIEGLLDYSAAEGDFQWGLACHPYPEDLTEPKTWNDKRATFSKSSPLVTFKNLEVLDDWIKQTDHKYNKTTKRTLWLSENGTNSKTYSEQDLREQAAGFAYAWKTFKQLDGIDAIQWHNWIDNRHEFGLRIGLRRFPDDETEPGGPKPVWHLYQAAGTNNEDSLFDPYKSVIGISDWKELDKKPLSP
ncbi:DUF5722 domain-containing protein [Sphingobacterium hungaricum]